MAFNNTSSLAFLQGGSLGDLVTRSLDNINRVIVGFDIELATLKRKSLHLLSHLVVGGFGYCKCLQVVSYCVFRGECGPWVKTYFKRVDQIVRANFIKQLDVNSLDHSKPCRFRSKLGSNESGPLLTRS